MKKSKPLSLHQIQTTSPSTIKKKSPVSLKPKVPKSPSSKKSAETFKSSSSEPEDYIIINDNIYSANTFTERNCYDQFLSKVKKEKQEQRKSFLHKPFDDFQTGKLKKGKESTKKKFKKLSPGDLIKCMSLDEKREMFYKLQEEIKSTNGTNILPVDLPSLAENNKQSQPCSTESFENDLSERMRMDSERERQEKFHMLEEKLETLKMQLLFKWEAQIEKLSELERKGKISEKEKEKKCLIIEKLKDHKLKIIECTKTLFQKILQEDTNENEEVSKKNDKIEAILQSLHSLPSLESLKDLENEKEPNIDHLKVNEKAKNNENIVENENFKKNKVITTLDSSPLEIVEDMGHEAFLSEFNEDIETKKIKIREELVSPLSFMNNSPNKDRFGEFEEVNPIVNNGFNNLPSKSEEMLRELLELEEPPKDKKAPLSIFGAENAENTKLSLKLDLRLDEIVFGQDEYPQCEKDEHSKSNLDNLSDLSYTKANNLKEKIARDNSRSSKKRSLIQFIEEDYEETLNELNEDKVVETIEEQKQSISDKKSLEEEKLVVEKISLNDLQDNASNNRQQEKVSLSSLVLNVNSQEEKTLNLELKISLNNEIQTEKELSLSIEKEKESAPKDRKELPLPEDETLNQLECHEVTHTIKPTIDIPMILSQEKMETLALEQNRLFRENIDRRIAFQMGCIELEQSESSLPHFTTLVDINSYIVGLYEFMMKKYMSSLVDSLNIPYGKSAIDKLYSLHTEGFVLEESYNQMNNILSEAHFKEYQREMTLTVRKCSDHETAHNRAVFEAFTKAINVYRPYYELEGEVFPWIVSEKGITFYEITEDNIEEVFEKSKIKVLEYCTSLCGIHTPSEVKNDEQSTIINNKNEENLNKLIKTETLEQFEEWKIRFVNFDCLVKLLTGKLIFAEIINEFIQEIGSISNKKDSFTE